MTHTYKINGMTCNGCRTSVENKIRALAGVEEVSVDLERETADIEMKKHISLQSFQKELGEKYLISEEVPFYDNTVTEEISSSEGMTKLQQLKPLLLIFLYIIVAVALLNYKDWSISEAMLDFMGLFYIVFSFFKMLDLKGFPQSFRMYDPLAKVIPVYGWIYPFIETALGIMFLMRFEIGIALVVTLVILGVTTFGVVRTLLNKKSIQCACLGTALKLPMTEATFIENSIMILMALVMLQKLYF